MSLSVTRRWSILAGASCLLLPGRLLARGVPLPATLPGMQAAIDRIDYRAARIAVLRVTPASPSETRIGIVIAHGCRGLDGFTASLAVRLAAAGHPVLVPDMLSLWGGTPDVPEAAAAMTQEFDPADMTGITAAAVRTMTAEGGPVALLGCEHGAWVAGCAAADLGPDLHALVQFYGLPPRPAEVARIRASLQFHHAGRDTRVASEIAPLRESLEHFAPPHEVHVYATAMGGFLDPASAAYDAALADLALTRALEFVQRGGTG